MKEQNPIDPYQIIEEVIEKLKSLEPWKIQWDTVDKQFRKVMNYGFFNAFLNMKVLENIIGRLDDCKTEKENLAGYLIKDFNIETASFFIESGSTLAYFAKYLSTQIPKSAKMPEVLTNNFFVQTLLLEVFPELRVTSGFLRKDYLSYVPFASDEQLKKASNFEDIKRLDRNKYSRLDNIISLCDIIYMTASTFGFLTGPSTRSRDNAIFKSCLLNNTARRPIKFCITEPKVFRNSLKVDRYNWTPQDTVDRHSIFTHFKDCCFIFDIQLLCDSEEDFCIKRARFKESSHIEKAIDGLIYKEYRLCRNKEKRCSNSNRQNNIYFRSVPSELGLHYCRGFMENPPVFGCYDTWLNYLNGQPKNNVELIIGCTSEDIVKDLMEAVEEANGFIRSAGYSFKYHRKLSDDEEGKNILHLVAG